MSAHGYELPTRAGAVFTDGYEVLRVEGSEPARIVDVESVGGSDALELLGAQVAGPERRYGSTQIYFEYPPKDRSLGQLNELDEQTLQPESVTGKIGYELLLGYKVLDPSASGRTGIRLTYVVGDTTYVADISAEIFVCPDSENPEYGCKDGGGQ